MDLMNRKEEGGIKEKGIGVEGEERHEKRGRG